MKVLYAYNPSRMGGGSNNGTRATIDLARRSGCEVEVFTRDSKDLPAGWRGRLQGGSRLVYPREPVRAFAKLLDQFRPDVVHIYEVFPLVSPWILPQCSGRSIPTVMNCDDYRLTCPVMTHLREGKVCTECVNGREHRSILHDCRHNLAESAVYALYNAMVRKLRLFEDHVSRFVVLSEFTRNWFIEHAGIAPARITVVPPVIALPESAADPANGSFAAFAGRFVPEKGIDVLLEAARVSGVPVRLCRDQNFFPTIQVPSDVQVTIAHNRSELDNFYRSARMFVLPSTWFETFGIVGAEAMAHGIPVIASRLGAMASLVRDETDGLLFEPGNSRDLAEKMRRLWDDRALCQQMGRAAYEKATHWGAAAHWKRLAEMYSEIIRQPLPQTAQRTK